MSNQEQKVCDVCRERPATRRTGYSHTGETRNLCVTCFEQTALPEEVELQLEQLLRNAKCRFCGAPAVCGTLGSMRPAILGVGNEQTESWFWCEPCRLDLVEFNSLPENKIEFPSDDKASMEPCSRQLAECMRRQEE